ncbi:MAG: insulinase family protein [Firmicutes bacterium]|nr:insulinase family protein [Bacillota bacterium]
MHEKIVLPGGLRLITEKMPHVRSVSIGVWLGSGSRHEGDANHGISHFLEHMLFKGTESRTAKQIADSIEGRGGQLNAFTTKEHTCIHAKVLDEDLNLAIDVLSDMILHSRFDPADVEKEKGVILEEIGACRDVPDDFIHDLAARSAWPEHPLGRDILGTAESVQSFSREMVVDEFQERYVKENALIVAVGNLSPARTAEAVENAFGAMHPGRFDSCADAPELVPGRLFERRGTEQAHVCAVGPGTGASSEDFYALHVLCSILGGTSGSRLFQKIREERGLAYSVYSYQSTFADCGLLTVYVGTSPRHALEALDAVFSEFDDIRGNGVTETEMESARAQARGSLLLSLESSSARMVRLGKSEMMVGRPVTPEQVLERIEAVSIDQVRRVAARALDPARAALASIGPSAVLPRWERAAGT